MIHTDDARVAEIARALQAKCAEIEHRTGVINADVMYFSEEYARAIASLPDKRDAALRLALPLLEIHQCAVIEHNNCLGEIDEIDTAIKAIRDVIGEDEK